MSKSTARLGKGLSTIIGAREGHSLTYSQESDLSGKRVLEIALDYIIPNQQQPRSAFDETTVAELAQSIRENGVLQPILVRRAPEGKYELIAGERRWRAARIAGLERVPALLREADDAETLQTALVENLQREDLAPLERASAYQRFIDSTGVSIEQLAERLGESRANVTNYLRLLRLRPEIQELIGSGELGMGQARAIAGIADKERQLAVARLAARRNLAVRQVEALARSGGGAQTKRQEKGEAQARHSADIEGALSKALGLRVRLMPGKKKNSGRLVIHFGNLEEFDRLAERIGGKAAIE